MTKPTSQGSIRRRLLVLLLLGAAVLAVGLYFVVQSVARQVARESQDNILAASALSVMDSARTLNGEITVDLPYAALSMLDSVSDERVFYSIWVGDDFLTGYEDLPRAAAREAGQSAYLSDRFLGEDVRVATVFRPISTDAGQSRLEVSIAQTLTGQRETLAQISRTSQAIGAGFFVLSALLALFVAQSTIRPLDRLTQSVSRRGPKDLRAVATPVPSEMVPLVSSLNGFMQRLQTSLGRSEDLIAEAAHRVRTPLAIVRTKAEIIQRRIEKPENQDALREMIHAIDDSSRAAGQLLDHAMVALRLDQIADETIELSAIVSETVDRLKPLSEIKDIHLSIADIRPVTMVGDSILVQSALHNLLDNAIKYTSAGSEIIVTLKASSGTSVIEICDTGPGFPKEDNSQLTDRFERGENAKGIVGSGLGLTIAKDVAEAHGGWLEIGNNPGGGACASLHFPSA